MRFIAKIENCPYGSRFSNGNTYYEMLMMVHEMVHEML